MRRGAALPGPVPGEDFVWLPMRMTPAGVSTIAPQLHGARRLAEGATLASANAELRSVAAQLEQQRRVNRGLGVPSRPDRGADDARHQARDDRRGGRRRAAAGDCDCECVDAAACADVQPPSGIRAAIGARRHARTPALAVDRRIAHLHVGRRTRRTGARPMGASRRRAAVHRVAALGGSHRHRCPRGILHRGARPRHRPRVRDGGRVYPVGAAGGNTPGLRTADPRPRPEPAAAARSLSRRSRSRWCCCRPRD